MRVDDFDFALPRELIADHPCEPRDAARLLFVPSSGGFEDRQIMDLPMLLQPGDLLVFNDTKVIPARLVGRRGAASIEVTLHRDLGGGVWRAFAKGALTSLLLGEHQRVDGVSIQVRVPVLVRPDRELKPGGRVILATA